MSTADSAHEADATARVGEIASEQKAAEEAAIGHILRALAAQPQRNDAVRLAFQRALGLRRTGNIVALRHRLIPTTALVTERLTGSFPRNALRGGIALLGSYARGEWDSDDLYATIQYLLQAERLVSVGRPIAHLWRPKHASTTHAQEESSLHYDLPPALFRIMTGDWSYSAIRWRYDALDVAAATRAHYDRVIRTTGLLSGHVVDLGAGWGTFADYVVNNTALNISCVTLSARQHAALTKRFANTSRASVLLADFCDVDTLPDQADLVTLFESIEHVSVRGRRALLNALHVRYPSAPLVIQTTCRTGFAATLRSRVRGALNEVVFPGPGTLATRQEILSRARSAGYQLLEGQEMTAEYAYSAMTWATRLQRVEPGDVGLPESVYRAFAFYLNTMAASLAAHRVSSNLFIFAPT
jgi:cyclopropane-fatty-acyl-phospholipid synthase